MTNIITTKHIAEFLQNKGIRCIAVGDLNQQIKGFSSLFQYKDSCMTFIVPERNLRDYITEGFEKQIALILMNNEEVTSNYILSTIRVSDPRRAFFMVVDEMFSHKAKHTESTIGENTFLSSEVQLSENVFIGRNCVINGNVQIGTGTIIGNNVTIENNVTIGEYCEILSGAVIGTDGFGFQDPVDGKYELLNHYGGVRIGNNVHIGSNTVVNRGMIDDTTICDGVKIDTLCHIAHNVFIEENCIIVTGSSLYGSARIGRNTRIVSAIIENQINVGEYSVIGMGSVVTKDIPSHCLVYGIPAKQQDKI